MQVTLVCEVELRYRLYIVDISSLPLYECYRDYIWRSAYAHIIQLYV